MAYLNSTSITVPVGPNDSSWLNLIEDFKTLPETTELFFVGTTSEPKFFSEKISTLPNIKNIKWINSKPNRALQLNTGALLAKRNFLWFLHADSRLTSTSLSSLEHSLDEDSSALHYFNLRFNDGPRLMAINTLGVWLRSRLLKMPFGDQGFCLAKDTFEKLSGFDEQVPYGEDHLLVWKARQQGIVIRCVKGSIFTSARKYSTHGWAKTTIETMYLTWKQALPEAMKLRLKKSFRLNKQTGAIAIFVKTPGISPIKTRLAKTIGEEAAKEFYLLSIAAIRETVTSFTQENPPIIPYWAVAEEDAFAHPLWRDFDSVFQHHGDLGNRLFHVYSSLLKNHRFVLLIGADSPQLPLRILSHASELLRDADSRFVIGPAADGGFYLFGGSRTLPESVWTSVPYSSDETGAKLQEAVLKHGSVYELPYLFDVDTKDDLLKLSISFEKASFLAPAQQALLTWLKRQELLNDSR